MDDEIWKPIPSYENLYEVSNIGRVRNKVTGLIRKQRPGGNGKYWSINLVKEKKQLHIGVHRLVAWAFIGPQKKGVEVRHINGIPNDNRIENLCYGTKSDNMKDAIKHGTFSMSEWHPCAKLSREQVREIYLSTDDYKVIAKKYNLHPFTIHQLQRRCTRKLDTEDIKDLKPVRKLKSKRDSLSKEQLQILYDLSIKQRDAAKMLGFPQRTIWLWRNKKGTP